MTKTLVTSALPYVNNIPHLGNIIGSTLSGDLYTRYLKLIGKEVYYLCGSDEYGTTTEIKAKSENLSCQDICTKYHDLHKMVYDWFDINFDVFGRTSTETQTKIAHEIFFELYKNNHIENREITQMYCESCDLYLADRYLQGFCYSENCKDKKIIANGDQCDNCGLLLDPFLFTDFWCSICKNQPTCKKTNHLYLKLSDFEDKLYDNLKSTTMTHNAYQITKSFLDSGLESRCITRDLKWGTPVPSNEDYLNYLQQTGQIEEIDKHIINYQKPNLDLYINKVFYVWFDAPIGYLSILRHAEPENWQSWLSGNIVQFMAKDNVPFHTIIFPASLLGSLPNKYPLATNICSTEYLDYEGTKFSKSKNIGIFGDNIIDISNKLNITSDYWRYYLAHIRPESHDSSFSWIEFTQIIKSELVNKIGNLINRCFALSVKYIEHNTLINISYDFSVCPNIFNELTNYVNEYIKLFDKQKIRDALHITTCVADLGNKFIQENTLWTFLKSESEYDKGIQLLGCANYITCILLHLLFPFMPSKCSQLLKTFNYDINLQSIHNSGKIIINTENYSVPFKNVEYKDVVMYSTKT